MSRSDLPATPLPRGRRRFAVVGGGISGLSSAWLLSSAHDVVLYEREPKLGGHSNTVTVDSDVGRIDVDTGFIVYNEWTYPNLCALFDHLDVATEPSEMSFAVTADNGRFEYSGASLAGLFGQPANLLRPRFWRMLRDLNRFYGSVPKLLENAALDGLTLGDLLDRDNYSVDFQRDHLLPMAAAIWSGTVAGMREYPAAAFARFFVNHGLFNYINRPVWRTVSGGSRRYVERISDGIETRHGGVKSVLRGADGVTIIAADGNQDHFDGVIMATHADVTLTLLDDASEQERRLLSPFAYQENTAVLHTDAALMPKRKRMWASWNYLSSRGADVGDTSVCVTYWMNNLQNLDRRQPLFVTLNPTVKPDPAKTLRTFDYSHPLFDDATETAQRNLWRLNGLRNTWFCGSYFGAGFHEDGLQSGLAAAEAAGAVRRPWSVKNESGRIHLAPTTATKDAA